MGKNVAMMSDPDAAECLPASELAEEEASSALGSTRVLRWKEAKPEHDCVRGFNQPANGLGSFRTDTHCLTCLTMLKLLTRLSVSFG